MTKTPRAQDRKRCNDLLPCNGTANKRPRNQKTVSEDVVCVASGAGGSIERQQNAQYIRVDGTLFLIGIDYLLQISAVYAAIDDPPVVWKINGVTDPVVFLATLRHLHPVSESIRVATLHGWSPRRVLDYIGTSWMYITQTISRLETMGEYRLASTFLHALDRQHRTPTQWNPQTITHWLTTYALLEPDDTGAWIDIKNIVRAGLQKRSLSVHETVLYQFLFVQLDNVSYSKALIGILRRWPLVLVHEVQQHLLRTSLLVIV
jgi:hypothetical protein